MDSIANAVSNFNYGDFMQIPLNVVQEPNANNDCGNVNTTKPTVASACASAENTSSTNGNSNPHKATAPSAPLENTPEDINIGGIISADTNEFINNLAQNFDSVLTGVLKATNDSGSSNNAGNQKSSDERKDEKTASTNDTTSRNSGSSGAENVIDFNKIIQNFLSVTVNELAKGMQFFSIILNFVEP